MSPAIAFGQLARQHNWNPSEVLSQFEDNVINASYEDVIRPQALALLQQYGLKGTLDSFAQVEQMENFDRANNMKPRIRRSTGQPAFSHQAGMLIIALSLMTNHDGTWVSGIDAQKADEACMLILGHDLFEDHGYTRQDLPAPMQAANINEPIELLSRDLNGQRFDDALYHDRAFSTGLTGFCKLVDRIHSLCCFNGVKPANQANYVFESFGMSDIAETMITHQTFGCYHAAACRANKILNLQLQHLMHGGLAEINPAAAAEVARRIGYSPAYPLVQGVTTAVVQMGDSHRRAQAPANPPMVRQMAG